MAQFFTKRVNLLQNAKIDSSVTRVTEHLKNYVGYAGLTKNGDEYGGHQQLENALKDVEIKLSALKNSRKTPIP